MKFSDLKFLGRNLFPIKHSLEKLQAATAERFELQERTFVERFDSISKNRMSLWNIGDSFPKVGTRFLLGVCPIWNLYDAYLLDCINESLSRNPIDGVFQVFNLDNLMGEHPSKIFGNTEKTVTDTVVLGIWEKGILSKSLWGWDAKNFLIEKFNFVWQPPNPKVGEVLFIK